ncbi:MAG: 50S ribosomal protein L34e [Candidatus Bathyarchaeales archaeon]
MPKPAQRTRSRKRVCKALPGGRTGIHFKLEVAAQKSCGLCGKPLNAVPRLPPSEIGKLNRTRKRIWRIYGGQICHNCLKTALKKAARTLNAA